MRVLLAGEGANELGGEGEGAIETLLAKLRPTTEIKIVEKREWRHLRKLRIRANSLSGEGDSGNVLKLALLGKELNCHAVVFLRDRDDDRSRQKRIDQAVEQAKKEISRCPILIAGVPIRMLEAWALALGGTAGSEDVPDPVALLEKTHNVAAKKTKQLVNYLQNTKLEDIPDDAQSLRRWLRECATTFRGTFTA